jgi:hypothetical protein
VRQTERSIAIRYCEYKPNNQILNNGQEYGRPEHTNAINTSMPYGEVDEPLGMILCTDTTETGYTDRRTKNM